MKIAAYLRVSTDRQAEEGLGLEVQEHAIRAWARSQGDRIVMWCRDEGVSGSNGLDTRDGLADALDACKTGHVAGLVVYRLDRLARDLVRQEQLLGCSSDRRGRILDIDRGSVVSHRRSRRPVTQTHSPSSWRSERV